MQHVMLSRLSSSNAVSITSSHIKPTSDSLSPYAKLETRSAQSRFVNRSQIPSHAITMNSSMFGSRACTIMSGCTVMRCSLCNLFFVSTSLSRSSALSSSLPQALNSKSPKHLLTAKSPSTLLVLTNPPSFSTRHRSTSLSGLWSKLNGKTTPDDFSSDFFERIARESPALAHNVCDGVINTTTPVHPERSSGTLSRILLGNSLEKFITLLWSSVPGLKTSYSTSPTRG
mmetsp:Transcript_21776/g.45642  ORF Transcript_21776/g.45642 Transcript_21776/m.45642 type:complete len:229 (-) Transcript_21776:692-1378(-)